MAKTKPQRTEVEAEGPPSGPAAPIQSPSTDDDDRVEPVPPAGPDRNIQSEGSNSPGPRHA